MAKYKVELNGYDVNDCEKLSHKEMMELIKEYQETNDLALKERIVMSNLKLVLSLIQKYQQRTDNMDDLFQVGVIGLIKAIDHFDVNLDLRFSTYAVPLIIGEVKRYLRDSSTIRIPRSLRDIAYKILIETEKYNKLYHKDPSVDELAGILEVDKNIVIEALNSTNSVSSLSQEVQNDGQGMIELEDRIMDKKDDYMMLNRHLDLNKAIRHLDDKEDMIIRQRYYEGLTQMEIAREMFISQAQVSRLEKQAIHKLRKYM